jgi:hypothetical protein
LLLIFFAFQGVKLESLDQQVGVDAIKATVLMDAYGYPLVNGGLMVVSGDNGG